MLRVKSTESSHVFCAGRGKQKEKKGLGWEITAGPDEDCGLVCVSALWFARCVALCPLWARVAPQDAACSDHEGVPDSSNHRKEEKLPQRTAHGATSDGVLGVIVIHHGASGT